MKRFLCVCGQPLFFDNTLCLSCSRTVGFDPSSQEMVAADLEDEAHGVSAGPGLRGQPLRRCRNALRHQACNWWITGDDDLCVSCRLTEIIPNLSRHENLERWRKLETAKRRLLYTLLDLDLPFSDRPGSRGLHFAFLEDRRTNPDVAESFVPIGHESGKVTIHAAEADDVYRETQRDALGQRYRTLLGHFRHESGHYYYERLIRDGGRLEEFRELFGDERADYSEALAAFYRQPPATEWRDRFVSRYAQAHPLEDWAESWKHFLDAVDTMETAQSFGLTAAIRREDDFDPWLEEWVGLTVILNELNRSVGQSDAYAFVLSQPVREKLAFIRSVASAARSATR